MPSQKENLRMLYDRGRAIIGLEFNPRLFSPSALQKMVDVKVNTKKWAVIYMERPDSDIFVNRSKVRQLPNEARREAIHQIAVYIAHSDSASIYTWVETKR